MNVSLNFIARIAGMLTLAFVGNRVGSALSATPPSVDEQTAIELLTLAGAGLGLLTTHRWTLEPIQRLIVHLRSIGVEELLALAAGALCGLVFAVLLAVPLGYLPAPLSQFLPLGVALAFGYGAATLVSSRRKELAAALRGPRTPPLVVPTQLLNSLSQQRYIIDTSAIIDGRIAQVGETGFLDGKLLVPRFVLAELQALADSSDEMKRVKGRRGLEILNEMQTNELMVVDIVDTENSADTVDNQLITLAQRFACPLITNDYNLGRVAKLQAVQVLSLNQLADAVRPPVVPGQDLHVTIRDVGREREQGISFLEDGTMIVVEDARRFVGKDVAATVTRIHQTQTGRIVFAHLSNGKH